MISCDSWRLIDRGGEALEHEEGGMTARVEAPESPLVGDKKTQRQGNLVMQKC